MLLIAPMANEAQPREAPEAGIIYRNTGREPDEFSTDTDLSLEHRLSLFERSEAELVRAENALKADNRENSPYGSREDILGAIHTLQGSAGHYADSISAQELSAALSSKAIRPEQAATIRERQSTPERSPLEKAADRYLDHYAEQDGLNRSGRDTDRSRDDEQER